MVYRIGKHEGGYHLSEFLLNTDIWKIGNTRLYHMLQVLLTVFLIGEVVFENRIAAVGLAGIVLTNLLIYVYSKLKYEIYLSSLADFRSIYKFAKWMEGKDREQNLFVTDDVKQALFRLRKMSGAIVGMNGRKQSAMIGDALALLADYLWGITLLDISVFNHIMKIIMDKQEDVLTLLHFAGEMDLEIAVLSYRESVREWSRPEFSYTGITAEGMVHPLLVEPVKNDFHLSDRAIITGANTSGKSTFMKAAAINCILAQTIHTCNAAKMRLKPVRVITCMSLRDDVLSGESYYFREAKYLKRMLDEIVYDTSVLIVIDEMLKGTNTKERIAASKAILNYIGRTNCFALVATHDNELTENKLYQDFYFSSQVKGNDIVFDYQIHEGTCEQSNAIALLSLFPRATSQVAALVRIFGDCREGQIPRCSAALQA